MHELSLCSAIAQTATEHADGRAIESIRLRIGHFRQVVPETLHFCWRARVAGTALEGCELVIDHVPATVECAPCGTTTTLEHPVLRCGFCESTEVALVSGDEFLIESIEVATPASRKDAG
jgi:hydrogenase nickel incorporation protein HypA/HybF